ncbi:octaprenyl diphosphate synthase [Candidatus Albibeggiatoa sp. nov. BB20]|uniref:octaprenyl diphosphate synthase n=1 Tax=Candidatus Albibeggiatoa sp. nov. BB20 TaxID=3162723 RepID=UPI00336594E1
MDVAAIQRLISDDMQAVNELIRTRLRSDVVLVNQISHYIINSGGKRLRPMLHLLCARALNYTGQHHITLATVIEFIHTSTLLHDDVVDASDMRRGKETANNIWGNEASVLVGDFLYSRSFQMMVGVRDMRVMDILANATNVIAEGEVLQLLNCHEPDITEDDYLQVIRSKTAKLFEAAAQLSAVIGNHSEEYETAVSHFGMHLGTAFQIVDDALDYGSSSEDIGKNIGDDLVEGKPTLPLIYALRLGTPEQQKILRDAIINGGKEYIDDVIAAIRATPAIDLAMEAAQKEAELAVNALKPIPDSEYKQALLALAHFSVHRTY